MKLIRQKWYSPTGMYPGRGPYPSPYQINRISYGAADSFFTSEGPTNKHISAAVVFHAETDINELIEDIPYILVYYFDKRKMVIASTDDPIKWIIRCVHFDAEGWMLGTLGNHTWRWTEPDLDEHNLKIRPLACGGLPPNHVRRKEYDKEAILEDLRHGEYNQTDIGLRHGVSRITVMKLAKLAGIPVKGARSGAT